MSRFLEDSARTSSLGGAQCALVWATVLLAGCGASDAQPDLIPGRPDVGVVVLGDLGPAETDSEVLSQFDVPEPCANRCAKEFPTVPPCKAMSWDIKTCSCSLRPAADGTACDDGVECTAADQCVAGQCEGGPAAELVEPSEGWQPEGTPLLQPDDPDWVWTAAHMDWGCRACDGSRAYLNWLATGSHAQSPYWAAAMPNGELATLELIAHLRVYDVSLEPLWDAPGSVLAGRTTTRSMHAGHDGSLYVGGWKDYLPASQASSWVGRFDAVGILLWERELRSRYAVSDSLPASDLGLYVVEAGAKSAAAESTLERSLSVRRLDADGNDIWATDIDGVWPLANSPFRLAPVREGGVVVAFMGRETKTSSDGNESEQRWVASAARFDAEGAIRWQTRLGSPEFSSHTGRITTLPDDEFMVFGVQWPTFGERDRYPVAAWRVDADGSTLSETIIHPKIGDYFLAIGATEAPDGAALVTGILTDYHGTFEKSFLFNDKGLGDTDGFIMKLDRWGNYEWMRLFGDPGVGLDMLWDVVASSDGRITATGVLDGETGSKVRNWILRTDFWGRTCGMRLGVCADMAWQDCEDGNPCTINWCDPDAGCTHPALPDGSPCGEGLTCQGAVCK
ncbi:MAG: hypothetical protein R3F39_09625 [Myxococcota bacterium]